jgi:hypothetical protein
LSKDLPKDLPKEMSHKNPPSERNDEHGNVFKNSPEFFRIFLISFGRCQKAASQNRGERKRGRANTELSARAQCTNKSVSNLQDSHNAVTRIQRRRHHDAHRNFVRRGYYVHIDRSRPARRTASL